MRIAKKFLEKSLLEISYYSNRRFLKPSFLSLLITNNCNFKCKSCSVWQLKNTKRLNDDEWEKVLKKIKKDFSKNTFIEINGGEPFLEKERLLKTIKFLKEKFNQVGINSNGSLIKEDDLEKLKNAKIDFIKISLYSLSPEIHNRLRGIGNAHELAINSIKLLKNKEIKTEIGILITRKNIHEIPSLISYLANLNKNISIILQPLDECIESVSSKNMLENNLPQNLWPNKEQLSYFFNYLRKNKIKQIKNSNQNISLLEKYYKNPNSALKYRCFAGQKSYIIYPDGNFSFCFKGIKLGNFLETKISKNLLTERKKIKRCTKFCRINGCNYSRGIKEIIADNLQK